MQATQKAPEIDSFITRVMGKSRVDTAAQRKCMTCDGTADSFKDAISEKEYRISGMCQACQDKVFG